jgi:uncharacterized iron-regulated protein
MMIPFLALVLHQEGGIDPMRLPIGTPGEVRVFPQEIRNIQRQEPSDADGIAKSADGKRFVFLGEQHATRDHQLLEARVVQALVKGGRHVVVGLEMLTRPKQSALDAWVKGSSEADFLKDGDWKKQWGFDFSFYAPVFHVCQANNVPMVALNVPRDWVRAVGRGGIEGLTPEQHQQLPEKIDLDWKEHRQVFDALIGGHPTDQVQGNRMYAAQVLWDVGMSDTAAKYLQSAPADTVFVVIAGSGHVMYRQGINGRLAERGLGTGVTVVMAESDKPILVSRGIADYVFVSRPAVVAKVDAKGL